jgi:uncharacterized protein YbaP (TraB family)
MAISSYVARVLSAVTFAAAALASQFTQAAGDRLLFWQVDTPGATVYLLGSMHLASPDIYPLRSEIVQAFEGAGSLAVEIDVRGEKGAAIQQRMLQRGQYSGGRTLMDDLSPETWRNLSSRLEQNGLPPTMMLGMKPGLVVTTLSTVEMMKLGLNPEQGIDKHFLNLASAQNKPVLELETVDQQLDAILDIPQPDLLVKQTLAQLEELDTLMAELVDTWKRGDADGLARLVIEDELQKHPEFADLHRRMFDDRNATMTAKILDMQARGGKYFVVVGAGHLVGKQGIVAMLERRGQSPRQL